MRKLSLVSVKMLSSLDTMQFNLQPPVMLIWLQALSTPSDLKLTFLSFTNLEKSAEHAWVKYLLFKLFLCFGSKELWL